MLKLILIFIIIGAIVTFLFNIFFTYEPLAEVDKKVTEAFSELEKTKDKFEEIEQDVVNDCQRIKAILGRGEICTDICVEGIAIGWIKNDQDFKSCVKRCESLANINCNNFST